MISDTDCSMNIFGVRDAERYLSCLHEVQKVELEVKTFAGQSWEENLVGINGDGKNELFMKVMREDLVLLCAQQYVSAGAAVLFEDNRFVMKLQEEEKRELREFISKHEVQKMLQVKINSTYRVQDGLVKEEMAMVANTYFNTKVNISNREERILAYF